MANLESANGSELHIFDAPTGTPTQVETALKALSFTNQADEGHDADYSRCADVFSDLGEWGDTAADNSEDTIDNGAYKSAGTPQKATNTLIMGANRDNRNLITLMAKGKAKNQDDKYVAVGIKGSDGSEVRFVGIVLAANIVYTSGAIVKVSTTISAYSDVIQTLGTGS